MKAGSHLIMSVCYCVWSDMELWELCKRGSVSNVRTLLASGGGQVRDVPHVNVRGGDGVGKHGRDVLDVNVRGGRLDRTCLMVAVRR